MLRRGWDPGPCHSPPGNAEPGRRAHPPSTPAAVPVPTGPWPRHSCAHCSRWSQVLLPRKQGEPCRSDTWDLGDARLGVWSGGWEPLPRSSDAPCTGSQTELPRAPGPSEVGWETAVGAAFPSSAFAPGSPEWALHSVPGWVQPSLGDRLTLTEQKGKLRPGAGDPAQGAAAEGRTVSGATGALLCPGGRRDTLSESSGSCRPGSTPKRLRPRRAQSRGAGQDRGALPSGVPAPAGCAAPPASSGTHFLVSGRPIFRQLLESVSAPGQRFRRPGCQGCPAVSRGSSPGRLRACAAGRRPAPRVAA